MDPVEALQKAMFAALGSHAGVSGLVGTRIYDLGNVPSPAPAYPYISFGPYVGTEEDTKTETGELAQITLDVWDRGIDGRHRVRRVLAAMKNCLHNQSLTLEAGTQVFTYFGMKQDFLDADGKTIHGVIRFDTLLND